MTTLSLPVKVLKGFPEPFASRQVHFFTRMIFFDLPDNY